MGLSIGHLKIIKSICSKWKINYFYVSQNRLKILGHLNTINFPFGTNGKLMVLSVPILRHFRVNVEAFQIYRINPVLQMVSMYYVVRRCSDVKVNSLLQPKGFKCFQHVTTT